jgi:uncharacterized protein
LSTPTPTLSPIEARVLGTLMEKARTVPDSYPLTLNTLLLGCNQKSSREPLMELDEAQILSAIETLQQAQLLREVSGARVRRFEHNAQRGLGVPEQSAVLLGVLMLRGAQTAAELRLNCERWYKFADISSVEGFLEEMQDRAPEKGGPMVLRMARAPGEREQRWAHLLCGPVDPAQTGASGTERGGGGAGTASHETLTRVERLESEVALLRATVEQLCQELGLSPPGQTQ